MVRISVPSVLNGFAPNQNRAAGERGNKVEEEKGDSCTFIADSSTGPGEALCKLQNRNAAWMGWTKEARRKTGRKQRDAVVGGRGPRRS